MDKYIKLQKSKAAMRIEDATEYLAEDVSERDGLELMEEARLIIDTMIELATAFDREKPNSFTASMLYSAAFEVAEKYNETAKINQQQISMYDIEAMREGL